jgi:hypothetical protein
LGKKLKKNEGKFSFLYGASVAPLYHSLNTTCMTLTPLSRFWSAQQVGINGLKMVLVIMLMQSLSHWFLPVSTTL